MTIEKLDNILQIAKDFAENNVNILALAFCGSRARGNAQPNSDVDLIFLVNDKHAFKQTDWIEALSFELINDVFDRFQDENYGAAWSRRVFLKSNTEIEFTFANRSWANVEPVDKGTFEVVSNGFKIIFDPDFILGNLVEKILSQENM